MKQALFGVLGIYQKTNETKCHRAYIPVETLPFDHGEQWPHSTESYILNGGEQAINCPIYKEINNNIR